MRIALGIEYLGTRYHGWQRQPDCDTVQGRVEAALTQIAAVPIAVHCAGRTDTGVHAVHQVIHFDTEVERPERAWVFGVNSKLPQDITVTWAKPIGDDFHARHSALKRRYRYYIYNHPVRPAIMHQGMTWCYQALDVTRMQAAVDYFLGEQDFSSFRAMSCQSNSPMRHVNDVSVTRQGDIICFSIEANAFLHHMVRNMAGVLITIGIGKAEPNWAEAVLQAKDRTQAAATAPAQGLYLQQVTYPEEWQIPLPEASQRFINL